MSNNLKATELRIGNYAEYFMQDTMDKEWWEAFQINGQDIKYLDKHQDDTDYRPIPLTEEWLDRLGFYSKYKSNHKMWNIFGFNLHQISDEDENGNKIPQEQIFYYAFSYEIKYVHQLQNLYFALIGKELTIKESENGK